MKFYKSDFFLGSLVIAPLSKWLAKLWWAQ